MQTSFTASVDSISHIFTSTYTHNVNMACLPWLFQPTITSPIPPSSDYPTSPPPPLLCNRQALTFFFLHRSTQRSSLSSWSSLKWNIYFFQMKNEKWHIIYTGDCNIWERKLRYNQQKTTQDSYWYCWLTILDGTQGSNLQYPQCMTFLCSGWPFTPKGESWDWLGALKGPMQYLWTEPSII